MITEFSKEKISNIEFRSKRLLDTEVDGRKPIDTKLLPRPDKEYWNNKSFKQYNIRYEHK